MKNNLSWQHKAKVLFQGLTIKKVEYQNIWEDEDKKTLVFYLNREVNPHKNDIKTYAMSDDEGNDVGAIHTNLKDFSVFPII